MAAVRDGLAGFSMHHATAFVLAGGQSARMGSDKAMLTWHGKTLLERALEAARAITTRVAILGPRERYAATGEWIVEDQFSGCGPLAGMHAALQATDTDLNVFLSVDMPFVPSNFLACLLERARSSPSALVVVPRAGGRIQSTCLACRRGFGRVCEQRLQRGLYKVEDALNSMPADWVEEDEIRALGFDAAIFRNLNTPEDLGAPGSNW